jgi:uncharacterized membrane protein
MGFGESRTLRLEDGVSRLRSSTSKVRTFALIWFQVTIGARHLVDHLPALLLADFPYVDRLIHLA